MSGKVICNDREFILSSYDIDCNEPNTFYIHIEKEDYSKAGLEEFLATSELYSVSIQNEDGFTVGIETDNYKLISVNEEGDTFELIYRFRNSASDMEELSAKIDYIAIMTDVDLEG